MQGDRALPGPTPLRPSKHRRPRTAVQFRRSPPPQCGPAIVRSVGGCSDACKRSPPTPAWTGQTIALRPPLQHLAQFYRWQAERLQSARTQVSPSSTKFASVPGAIRVVDTGVTAICDRAGVAEIRVMAILRAGEAATRLGARALARFRALRLGFFSYAAICVMHCS